MADLEPVSGNPFAPQLTPVDHDPWAFGLTSPVEGSMRDVVPSGIAKHADWTKFEREARPSENIEDVRGKRHIPDPVEAIGTVLDKAAQYGEPQLTPVSGDPFADSIQGDVGAAGKALQTQEAARRATVGGLLQHFTLPGRIAQGVKPETPGMMSEADAYRLNQLQNEAENWAPQQAANMIGSGVPRAEAGALGSSGGGIKKVYYHGSPYDFDKFDVSKIGTGEGNQAYGHGLYFAENPATAEAYKAALAPVRGKVPDDLIAMPPKLRQAITAHADSDVDALTAAKRAQYMASELRKDDPEKLADMITRYREAKRGRMYEVNINADPEHFLDWDKPLSEQHPKVQQALDWRTKGPGVQPEEYIQPHHTGEDIVRDMKEFFPEHSDVAQHLREAGIPGIKYLDQGSRGAAEGTHNYVVFHHGIVDILKKYGLAGLVAGGAAHFSTTPHNGDPFSQ